MGPSRVYTSHHYTSQTTVYRPGVHRRRRLSFYPSSLYNPKQFPRICRHERCRTLSSPNRGGKFCLASVPYCCSRLGWSLEPYTTDNEKSSPGSIDLKDDS